MSFVLFLFQEMATKVGTMKAKSKSESSQNRPKRPAKYRSMTLKRQEAKCDVTINIEDTENSQLEDSFFNTTSKFFNKLFMTPPSQNSKTLTSSSSVNDPTKILSRKRSFVL